MDTTTVPASSSDSFNTLINTFEDWKNLEKIVQILGISAEAAPARLSQALVLLAQCVHAYSTALIVLTPGNTDINIIATYPIATDKEKLKVEKSVHTCIANGGTSVFFIGDKEKSLDAICRIAAPLMHEGSVFGALCIDVQNISDALLERAKNIVTIAAVLFTPALFAKAMTLHTHIDKKTHIISKVLQTIGIVGTSEAMQPVYARLAQVAPTATTVLLRGESGTGKELVARALHAASSRAQGPFVSLSCAALPESLIESELFGHEKGAFTGASAMRKGRFELAHGGTLFLDEVGELPLLTQVKLLRVLQERSFERLGGMESRQVDIRIITATNRSLEGMVEDGRFRRDLYYRLNVFSIHLPSLKERKSDILLLAHHFISQFATRHRRAIPNIALSAADMLHRYAWPGNIRELENMMERALLLMDGNTLLLPQHLPPELHSATCPLCATALHGQAHQDMLLGGSLPERLEELERVSIIDALTSQHGHIGQAANVLGLTERVLYLRMRKYGLSFHGFRKLPAEINNNVESANATPTN